MEQVQILRVVIREDFSEDMADQLIHDILSITEDLTKQGSAQFNLAHLSSGGGAHATSAANSKHPAHSKLSKITHNPGHNRGVKGKGYAKQC